MGEDGEGAQQIAAMPQNSKGQMLALKVKAKHKMIFRKTKI